MLNLVIPFYLFIFGILFNIFFGTLIALNWNEIMVTYPNTIFLHFFQFWIISFQLYAQYQTMMSPKTKYLELSIFINMCLSLPIVALLIYDFTVTEESISNLPPQNITDSDIWTRMESYGTSATVKSSWNAIQRDNDCCGWNDAKDWETLNINLPESCRYENLAIKANGCGCKILVKFLELLQVTKILTLLYNAVMIITMIGFNLFLLGVNICKVFKKFRITKNIPIVRKKSHVETKTSEQRFFWL